MFPSRKLCDRFFLGGVRTVYEVSPASSQVTNLYYRVDEVDTIFKSKQIMIRLSKSRVVVYLF